MYAHNVIDCGRHGTSVFEIMQKYRMVTLGLGINFLVHNYLRRRLAREGIVT